MASGVVRIDTLSRDNYDTWRMQMEAVLIKTDAWDYVSGKSVKPVLELGNAKSQEAVDAWILADSKARSDIILSISATELKQIKGYETSREVWMRLQAIYQSSGPARKATLLKQLVLQRMRDGEDVREHLRKFFDAVDKLSEMSVEINKDLLTILLLYSLPVGFENFRCAIESRDELPTPEALRVKICEEYDARKNDLRCCNDDAMVVGKFGYNKSRNQNKNNKNHAARQDGRADARKPVKCYRCHKVGHKAADCRQGDRTRQDAQNAEHHLFHAQACSCNDRDARDACDALLADSQNRESAWCLDSGCSSHLCRNLNKFSEVDVSDVGEVRLANDSSTKIKARGRVSLQVRNKGSVHTVDLSDTLFVPDLRMNLLSVGRITDSGYSVIFEKHSARIVDGHGNTKLNARRKNDLYYLQTDCESECMIGTGPRKSEQNLLRVWHRRLGHLNVRDLISAVRGGAYVDLNIANIGEYDFKCDVCPQGKMTRTPFPRRPDEPKRALEGVHSDLCGPMRNESMSGARYFITFIDDRSRWCEVRFLKRKSDAFVEFKKVKALMENQKGVKIKYLQSDNGTEYINTPFNEFLNEHGIRRRLTIANNPEQNGVSERKNRTLVETARCLLIQSGLPPSFWAEAVSAANYLRNRCPSRSLGGKTPFEVWYGRKPGVDHLREFGSRVFVLDRSPQKGKFEKRTKEGILLGNSEQSKGYRVWLPSQRRVEISRDIKLVDSAPTTTDNEEPLRDLAPGGPVSDAPRMDIQLQPSDRAGNPFSGNHMLEPKCPGPGPEGSPSGLRECSRTESDFLPKSEDYVSDADDGAGGESSETASLKRGPGRPRKMRAGRVGRPSKMYHFVEQSYLGETPVSQAVSGTDAEAWLKAMASELTRIIKYDTWELVDRPTSQRVIGSRMVLRNKYGPDGKLVKRKARVVAQGFTQRPGVDFGETFSPVARLNSVRLIAALASHCGMSIHQMDVATAFLNGSLDEDIFMEVPKLTDRVLDFILQTEKQDGNIVSLARKMREDLKRGDKVCKLKRALYGLRQAGRQWHSTLDRELKNLGAVQSRNDPCVYYIGRGKDLVVLAVYVDDILLASRNLSEVSRLKAGLQRRFDVKDLGEIRCCLGLEFSRHRDGYFVHQSGYVRDILERFGMGDCKPVSAPMTPGRTLSESDNGEVAEDEDLPYRELTGSLMYLASGTRPDIAHAVSWLCSFNDCYKQEHWVAAKRVLRYLKGTLGLGIFYGPSENSVTGYVDADWGNCPVDRRSYTGYVFTLSCGAISWESRKQRTVALSSTEAEYMGLSDAVKEAIYLRRFLLELGFGELASVKMFCDNMGALKLASNPVFHARTKHIDVRHHFVRDAIKDHLIDLQYLPTERMAADVLTKGLPGPKHRSCLSVFGMLRSPRNEGAC